MSHTLRRNTILGTALLAGSLLGSFGCNGPDVGSIKADDDGPVAVKSKTEGRFKETVPSKPSRRKAAPADEGIESR